MSSIENLEIIQSILKKHKSGSHDLSSISKLPWEIIQQNDDYPWDWEILSSNPSIPFDFFKKHSDKPWNFQETTKHLSLNDVNQFSQLINLIMETLSHENWDFNHITKCFYFKNLQKEKQNKFIYDLLEYHPVLLNTSFNIQGKPILNTYKEAMWMKENTGVDEVITNKYIL